MTPYPVSENQTLEWLKAYSEIPETITEQKRLAAHTPNTEIIKILFQGTYPPEVKAELAKNPHLSREQTTKLAQHPWAGVRRVVSSHPTLPESALFKLLDDNDWAVAAETVKNFTPQTPYSLWLYASRHANPMVRFYTKTNPHKPSSVKVASSPQKTTEGT